MISLHIPHTVSGLGSRPAPVCVRSEHMAATARLSQGAAAFPA
jgi:hypothetical protein